jgi:hypothetical protein
MKFRPLFLLAACACGLDAQTPPGCRVVSTTYDGWKTVEMSNPWVRLEIVPQLGGRLMQVAFGGHDFLFVNQQLKGQTFSVEDSASQNRWFNYGGDKIWPMPEGNQDEQHWPGAVGEPLDSGAFTAQTISQGATCTVRLTGPVDAFIGQQYIRDISIGADSPDIRFHAVMKNVSGYPQEWSEQSVSQYNTANPQNAAEPNPDLWAFTPQNPQSAFLNGYHVRSGMANTQGYSLRNGLFTLHYLRAGGEVWVDSPGDWLAVVDGATRYTMVERFHVQRGAEYPGKTTAIFYTTGVQTGGRRGAPPPPPPDPSRPQIFYMEAELNSPLVKLAPGESYAMDTEWYPTRMGSEFKTATYAGVVGQPLAASATPQGLSLAGEFGVFFAGRLVARFYSQRGMALGTTPLVEVTPAQLVQLQQTVQPPAETGRVSIHLVDRQGVDRGPLGETVVAAAER